MTIIKYVVNGKHYREPVGVVVVPTLDVDKKAASQKGFGSPTRTPNNDGVPTVTIKYWISGKNKGRNGDFGSEDVQKKGEWD